MVLIALLALPVGCGDDDSGDDDSTTRGDGGDADGGDDDGSVEESDDPPVKKPDASKPNKDDAGKPMTDGGTDAMIDDPFEFDASGDYNDAEIDPTDTAGPPPDDWSCPAALWADGICDCGCTARDWDCKQFSCTEPGCLLETCGACFAPGGAWRPCTPEPDVSGWTCDPSAMQDDYCDCGCGIEDPTCRGSGCTFPGCRFDGCDIRNNCGDGVTDPSDICTQNPPAGWNCAWDAYGGGNGCDCGCGVMDPDCSGLGGCTTPLCTEAACITCFDYNGRPYACDAAAASWNEGAVDQEYCSATRYATGDGCDCGCGGPDPDCEGNGCDEPGCRADACDRCTEAVGGRPVGCNPGDWEINNCDPASYGTGDGCDCGCGTPDPDCDGGGSTDDEFTDDCDVCNDGNGGFVKCPAWTCTDDNAWNSTTQCDCGCGAIDPACRLDDRLGCTEPGCESPVCQYCNDEPAERAACGGEWTESSVSCAKSYYGLDGLCDCGCSAADPDCAEDEGCVDNGCVADGCDVCHDSTEVFGMKTCTPWACDAAAYGSGDGCDCGCGLEDPDCNNEGCLRPGCSDDACTVCHDIYGRAVPCP